MSTTATPDVEQKADATAVPEDLEHLDFEPVCAFTQRNVLTGVERPCSQPAAWWVRCDHHCVDGRIVEGLICDRHFKHLMSGGTWFCPTCSTPYFARLLVRRTESLR